MSSHEVTHDATMTTFSVDLGDAEAVLTYLPVGEDTLDFVETYVPSEYRGKGIAAALAGEAFEYARKNGYRVIPSCPYIGTYLKRHPEYQDLVRSS
ncbi:MAG: GNAT family N-acetyltransferase [Spirochaetota bacterium]